MAPRDLGRGPLGPKSCLFSLLPRSQRSCLSYSPGARRQLTSGRRRWTGYSSVSHRGNADRREEPCEGKPGHCLYVVATVHDPRNPGYGIPGSYTWYILTVHWNSAGLSLCLRLPLLPCPAIVHSNLVSFCDPYPNRGSFGGACVWERCRDGRGLALQSGAIGAKCRTGLHCG